MRSITTALIVALLCGCSVRVYVYNIDQGERAHISAEVLLDRKTEVTTDAAIDVPISAIP